MDATFFQDDLQIVGFLLSMTKSEIAKEVERRRHKISHKMTGKSESW